MPTPDDSIDRRAGLLNVIDIVVAPSAVFERLRVVPVWGWAFLASSLLAIAGALLAIPAVLHALDVSLPAQFAANPDIAKLPPDQQQKRIAMMVSASKTIVRFSWLIAPIAVLIVALLQGVVMTIVNAITHGAGVFKKFFALSVTASIVGYGLNSIIAGIVAVIRGSGSFESTTAIQGVVPSLAMLAPGIHGPLVGFLYTFNVFYLWAAVLLALGMHRIGRIPSAAAWVTAALMLLFGAGFNAFGTARS